MIKSPQVNGLDDLPRQGWERSYAPTGRDHNGPFYRLMVCECSTKPGTLTTHVHTPEFAGAPTTRAFETL